MKSPEETIGSPIRIGILGCSDIASRKFAPALKATGHAVLAGIASRSPEKAGKFAVGPGCRVHTYASLVDDPRIDLVYISLPNHLHEQWAIEALQQGKHVICEKPLGLSADSVERMVATAEDKGLLLYENLMYLHHPQHAAVRNVLPEIGRIRVMRTAFGFTMRDPGNFRLDPGRGGGAFHDLARYPLSAALHFLQGELDRFEGISFSHNGLNTGMHGMALSSANELFQFGIDFSQQYESFYELVGDRGKIRVERAFTTPPDVAGQVQLLCGTKDLSFGVPPADHFRLMIEHVCSLVAGSGNFRAEHDRSRSIARLGERLRAECTEIERN